MAARCCSPASLSAAGAAPLTAARAALFLAALWPLAAGQTRPATAPAQTAPAARGQKLLTLQAIYGPQGRVDFDGSYARGMTWLPDGEHFLHRRDNILQRVAAVSGAVVGPAYDCAALEAALRAQAAFDEQAARRLARRPTRVSKDRAAVLIEHERRLYFYRFDQGRLVRLSDGPLARRELGLSPHGGYVSYVQGNNLYVIETGSGRRRRLTHDGSPLRLNGVLDWVYMEELYGRGSRRGYWWRDDERYIAFLQLREQQVPNFTIVNQLAPPGRLEKTPYPKAGDPNPLARLGIARPDRNQLVWVDHAAYRHIPFLIVSVSWAPDGKLNYQVQDREQRWLELNQADPATGRTRTLLRETSPAWVDVLGPPHWLKDGSFLWRSARDGYRHLYHYSRAGKLLARLTSGKWDVTRLHGAEQRSGWVYFSARRDSPLEEHAYRVRLGGGPIERLTEPGFSHRVRFAPTFGLFIDTFSSVTTPPKVHLRRADGELVRVISANPVKTLAEYKLSTPEFVQFPARDGYPLHGLLIRPPDFDPQRRYPVWSWVYGGPYAATVRNRWGGRGYLVRQLLAQKGYLCWSCDPRSASGQGSVSAWQAYRRLGQVELADLEDGVRWLIDRGYADPARVGISGYSYGGFLVTYALTHSDLFSVGVAGAPVTDWRNYDTIYTERYMQTPAHNPQGYARSSCVRAAADLHGKLLLVHGLLDDNVHFQNTLQLIDALQKNRKQFDLMVYPRDRHRLGHGRRHYLELWLRYIYQHL